MRYRGARLKKQVMIPPAVSLKSNALSIIPKSRKFKLNPVQIERVLSFKLTRLRQFFDGLQTKVFKKKVRRAIKQRLPDASAAS